VYESKQDLGLVNISFDGLENEGYEYVMISLTVSDERSVTIPDSSTIFYWPCSLETISDNSTKYLSICSESTSVCLACDGAGYALVYLDGTDDFWDDGDQDIDLKIVSHYVPSSSVRSDEE